METFLSRHKNLAALVIVLAGQIVGLAVQVKVSSTQGGMSLMRLWSISTITPVEKALVHGQHGVFDGWSNYFYLRGVRKENRELRGQIEQMRLEQVRLRTGCLAGATSAGAVRLQGSIHLADSAGTGHRIERQRSVANHLHRQRLRQTAYVPTWR